MNILHVGIGNSGFAQRFAHRVNLIDGLTVSRNEEAHAGSLGIGNYRVLRINKHTRKPLPPDRYDLIIDNNLTMCVCCKYHFYLMLDNYLESLKANGRILTDQQGMNSTMGDPRWKLTYEDLVGLENKFPVKLSKLTSTIYSIEKC
jgi:hypothetical protein